MKRRNSSRTFGARISHDLKESSDSLFWEGGVVVVMLLYCVVVIHIELRSESVAEIVDLFYIGSVDYNNSEIFFHSIECFTFKGGVNIDPSSAFQTLKASFTTWFYRSPPRRTSNGWREKRKRKKGMREKKEKG